MQRAALFILVIGAAAQACGGDDELDTLAVEASCSVAELGSTLRTRGAALAFEEPRPIPGTSRNSSVGVEVIVETDVEPAFDTPPSYAIRIGSRRIGCALTSEPGSAPAEVTCIYFEPDKLVAGEEAFYERGDLSCATGWVYDPATIETITR